MKTSYVSEDKTASFWYPQSKSFQTETFTFLYKWRRILPIIYVLKEHSTILENRLIFQLTKS